MVGAVAILEVPVLVALDEDQRVARVSHLELVDDLRLQQVALLEAQLQETIRSLDAAGRDAVAMRQNLDERMAALEAAQKRLAAAAGTPYARAHALGKTAEGLGDTQPAVARQLLREALDILAEAAESEDGSSSTPYSPLNLAAGLLPAVARLVEQPSEAQPVEVAFATSSWLVESGDFLRGYRHPGWTIEPLGPMVSFAHAPDQRLDMLGRANVVGSRLWVNLAANEHLLRRFLTPAVTAGIVARRGF